MLLEHGLADEALPIVAPVLSGTGNRLFAKGPAARSFELVGTQAGPSGVILRAHRVGGRLKNGKRAALTAVADAGHRPLTEFDAARSARRQDGWTASRQNFQTRFTLHTST
jgi:hypothetical protein